MISETVNTESGTAPSRHFIDATVPVRSRGRVYTTTEQRQQLRIGEPRGTELLVFVSKPESYDESSNWATWSVAEGRVTMQQYGEFVLPQSIRDELNIHVGDTVNIRLEREYVENPDTFPPYTPNS